MSIADANLVIAFVYFMFLHRGVTTDTFHGNAGGYALWFISRMGKTAYVDISPFDLIDWSQELVDKYATKERIQIVFTPCDGSPKDKGDNKGRKYWVVESNDPEYPLGSKVRRDRVNELMGERYQFRARIRIGFGKCPTWCPHCMTITKRIANLWHALVGRIK